MQNLEIIVALPRRLACAATLVTCVASAALAQTPAANPHHPDTSAAQATPPSQGGGAAGEAAQSARPGMSLGMMGQGMIGQNMMDAVVQPGTMRQGITGAMRMGMRSHVTKIVFAVADADADEALSFEEVSAIHERIFESVDANKDGKVTREEVQSFMRE